MKCRYFGNLDRFGFEKVVLSPPPPPLPLFRYSFLMTFYDLFLWRYFFLMTRYALLLWRYFFLMTFYDLFLWRSFFLMTRYDLLLWRYFFPKTRYGLLLWRYFFLKKRYMAYFCGATSFLRHDMAYNTIWLTFVALFLSYDMLRPMTCYDLLTFFRWSVLRLVMWWSCRSPPWDTEENITPVWEAPWFPSHLTMTSPMTSWWLYHTWWTARPTMWPYPSSPTPSPLLRSTWTKSMSAWVFGLKYKPYLFSFFQTSWWPWPLHRWNLLYKSWKPKCFFNLKSPYMA